MGFRKREQTDSFGDVVFVVIMLLIILFLGLGLAECGKPTEGKGRRKSRGNIVGAATTTTTTGASTSSTQLDWKLHYLSGRIFSGSDPANPFPLGTWSKKEGVGVDRYALAYVILEVIGGDGERFSLGFRLPPPGRGNSLLRVQVEELPDSRWSSVDKYAVLESYENGDYRLWLNVVGK